jgi:single-strand DNA-binding protein
MSTVNSCHFIGYLGRDPEEREVGKDQLIAKVSLGVSGWRKNKDDERTTDWVPLTFWNTSAENALDILGKGDLIAVVARFSMNSWEDDDGNNRYYPEFTVQDWQLLKSAPDGDDDKDRNGSSRKSSGNGNSRSKSTSRSRGGRTRSASRGRKKTGGDIPPF